MKWKTHSHHHCTHQKNNRHIHQNHAQLYKRHAKRIQRELNGSFILWVDFKTDFMPISIKLWTITTMTSWVAFLAIRYIHIDTSGRKSREKSLIELLCRDRNIPSRRVGKSMVTEKEEIKEEKSKIGPKLDKEYQYHTKEDDRRRQKEEDNLIKPMEALGYPYYNGPYSNSDDVNDDYRKFGNK